MNAALPPAGKIRVLIYMENYLYGGLERFVFDLLNSFDRDKFEPVLVYNDGTDFPARLAMKVNPPVEAIPLKIYGYSAFREKVLDGLGFCPCSGFLAKAPLALARFSFVSRNEALIKKELPSWRPDVLHVINGGYPAAQSCIAAALAAKFRSIPVVFSVLARPSPRRVPILDARLDRAVRRAVDVFVPNCDAVARDLSEKRGIPREKIRVVHTGIDFPPMFDPEKSRRIRQEWLEKAPATPPAPASCAEASSQSSQPVIIGMLSSFGEVKGHRYLMDAAAILKKDGVNFRIVLEGDGPTRPAMEEMARRLGLANDVIFIGYHSGNPLDVLAAYDILALPSLLEGFPYVVLEAMALAKPVVASSVDGIPEQVEHGVSGILVPPAAPPALAEALGRLCLDPNLRRRLGETARGLVSSLFSRTAMITEIQKIYTELSASGKINPV